MQFWFDEEKRLAAAQQFQQARVDYLQHVWSNDRELKSEGFILQDNLLKKALETFHQRTDVASKFSDLLLAEGQHTKALYQHAANNTQQKYFIRQHKSLNKTNDFLNHGNYLAYGLAASCLWVLSIPHSFAVMHGKTRRGALVFDVADLIKDAIVLPYSFICARENASEQQFRQQVLQAFVDQQALDFMFKIVKAIALQNHSEQDIKEQNL